MFTVSQCYRGSFTEHLHSIDLFKVFLRLWQINWRLEKTATTVVSERVMGQKVKKFSRIKRATNR